jgi:hypothetical protein
MLASAWPVVWCRAQEKEIICLRGLSTFDVHQTKKLIQ